MNKTTYCLFQILFVAGVFLSQGEIFAGKERPENFWEHSTSLFTEGDDVVELMIGGYKTKEYEYTDIDGIKHYKISKIDRSDEIWKHNRETGEWVQLKPYDESWRKVPPMAGHQALQNKLDGYVYCFGGRNANGDSSVYMLNLQKGEWRQLGFHKFYGHEKTAVAVDFSPFGSPDSLQTGKAVFHGGIVNGLVSNELHKVSFSAAGLSIESQTTPRALYGHSAIYDKSADVWHFWGGQNENGYNYDNFQYSSASGFEWGPQMQGQFIMPRSSGATLTSDNTLFVWGGKSYSYLRKAADGGDEIRTDLCAITAKNGQLYGRIIATGLPPVSHTALSMDVVDGDTLFYVSGGISTIWTEGDTSISDNIYRYNINKNIIQQYDTTAAQWGELITTVEEEHFPVSPELHVDVPVWPNPAGGMVSYQLQKGIKAKSVKLYNQLGQMVMHINNPRDNRFDLSAYAPGIYFMRIDTDTKPCFARIVKITK
ncbi:MAG TPA: T9SS type A sorting domain-containing protein [bacterium]|nr:T9SS type A sorting domain-containing protein [bacterium]HPN45988.1 T9SS type A sorting domain-containing protein [bacterium]